MSVRWARWAVVVLALWGQTTLAAERALVLGVFIPTTLDDGQQRFRLGEALAAELAKVLGREVTARNFGRYEDFHRAAQSGLLDVVLMDGWVASQSDVALHPVAFASMGSEPWSRWVVVSKNTGTVADLRGKRLSLVRGTGPSDAKFVSNVVFAGDLDAKRHFRLISVPNVESAVQMVEARGADAALVPAEQAPPGLVTRYKSPRLPGPVLAVLRGDDSVLREAVSRVQPPAPLQKLIRTDGAPVEFVRKLVARPPKRRCVIAESPLLRIDGDALFHYTEVGQLLPAFTEFIEQSKEQPDD